MAAAARVVTVPGGARCGCRRIRDGDLEAVAAVGELDVDPPAPVPRGVRQRLLQDAGTRPGRAPARAAAAARRLARDWQPGRAVALDERLERRQRRGRLDAVAAAVLAQRPDEPVDLADRLARDLLDRRQRRPRPLGVALLEQPGGAGLHEDHVDRVRRRVVEVARDPRPLLRGREAALALELSLGLACSLDEVAEPLPPLGSWSPTTQAPSQTTTPNRIGLVGKPESPTAVMPTWSANSASTTAAVSRSRSRVRSSVATKKSVTVGPN